MPLPRYEAAARKAEDAIRRLRENAPSFGEDQLHEAEAAIAQLDVVIPEAFDKLGRRRPEPKCYLNGGQWYYKGALWFNDEEKT